MEYEEIQKRIKLIVDTPVKGFSDEDMAKKDKDGYIYLVARKKEIIKVGGKRISPKEIEEVIVSIPEVVDCTIEGVYDEILAKFENRLIPEFK